MVRLATPAIISTHIIVASRLGLQLSSGVRSRHASMTDELLEEVRQFVVRKLGVRADRIQLTTSLFHDLGVDGADGWEFTEAFGARFGVDLSSFDAALHFGPEAGGNPLVWVARAVTGSWPGMVPITLADLAEAARSGRWQAPTHAPRSAI